jgi:hypothetical protein
MYTELHYNVLLRRDTPQSVIDVLEYMLDNDLPQPSLPDHWLFRTERWKVMLRMSSASFAAPTHSELTKEPGGYYVLSVCCNLKNYNEEIEKFVDWMDSYVAAFKGDFLGYSRYEESEDPDIIRKK